VANIMPQPCYRRETAPGTYQTGGWVGFTASFDALEKRKISCSYQISYYSTAHWGKWETHVQF